VCINEAGLMAISPREFTRQPCCYYRVQEIRNYGIGVFSSGIGFILTLMGIGLLPLITTVQT